MQEVIFKAINQHLEDKGLLMKRGTLVDATIIAAPSSTKNKSGKRDSEMSSTRKGHQYYFGMKAHIGVDGDSSLVHSLVATKAKRHDSTQREALLHGEEQVIGGVTRATLMRNSRHLAVQMVWFMPSVIRRNGIIHYPMDRRNVIASYQAGEPK